MYIILNGNSLSIQGLSGAKRLRDTAPAPPLHKQLLRFSSSRVSGRVY